MQHIVFIDVFLSHRTPNNRVSVPIPPLIHRPPAPPGIPLKAAVGLAILTRVAVTAGDAGRVIRTVSFYREAPQLGVPGDVGYGELSDDAPGPVRWNIYLPANAVPKGSIVSRDIAIDDEGNRYQVAADGAWVQDSDCAA
jgi:hypothetical protein